MKRKAAILLAVCMLSANFSVSSYGANFSDINNVGILYPCITCVHLETISEFVCFNFPDFFNNAYANCVDFF